MVTALAGGGTSTAEGILATDLQMQAYGFARNAAGDLFISGISTVRLVPATAGTRFGIAMEAGRAYTILGGGSASPAGVAAAAGATALAAGTLIGVSVDQAGNVYVADRSKSCVYMRPATTVQRFGSTLTPDKAYVVAGQYGGTGVSKGSDDVPATGDTLFFPMHPVFDSSGNLIVGQETGRVRFVAQATGTAFGRAVTAGNVYSFATTGNFAVEDVFVGASGEILLGGSQGATKATIWRVGADGSLAVLYEVSNTRYVVGVTRDTNDNLLFSTLGKTIEILPAVSGSAYGMQLTQGATASIATGLGGPKQLQLDGEGNIYFNDTARILRIKR